jgi:hypothetical protein
MAGSEITPIKNIQIIQTVLRGLMLAWTVICIAYHVLLFLISARTTDFNGKPYGPDDYLFVALILITIILQLFILPRLLKKISLKILLALLGGAFLPWSVAAIIYRDLGNLLVPVIYAIPLVLLYGGYWLAALHTMPRKQKFSHKKDGVVE